MLIALRRTLALTAALATMPATMTSGKAAGISVDLSITKVAAATVSAGSNLSYTITVINNNASTAASGGQLDDTLPAGTTFVSLSAAAGWSCTTPSVGGTGAIQCTIATVAASANAVFTLVVQVASGTPQGAGISNTATISSQTPDPTPGNNTATATTTVTTVNVLSISKTDSPDPVAAGANLTYTIIVNSLGPSDAATISLSDPLPSGTTFVSMTSPAGWTTTAPAIGGTGTVTVTKPTLAAGASGTFTLVVHVLGNLAAGTVLSNTATVTWASIVATLHGVQTTSIPTASATATTTVSNTSDMTITKIDTPDPVTPGSNLVYTITVTNNGPSDSGSATLTDGVPANTTFVSLVSPAGWVTSTPAVGGSGLITATNPTLVSGSVHQFTLTVNVGAATPVGTTLSNTVSLAWTPTLPAGFRGATVTITPATATATTTVAAAVPTLPRQLLILIIAAVFGVGLWWLRRRNRGIAV